MRVKKACGKIYGASMSVAEKKAMNLEIQRQLAEYDQKHLMEIDALILWVLHDKFGFGPKRLKQYYDSFTACTDELMKRYEMDDGDEIWLCTHMLKRIGVDIEAWHKEGGRKSAEEK